ncbi:proline--tRNA ligase, partial [Salmonella enterica subsp. enterica serovar Typhimurium]
VRGHHELNEVKLKAYFGTEHVEMATQDEIVNLVDANPGSIGPIFEKDIKIYADNYLQDLNNFVVGANEDHYH